MSKIYSRNRLILTKPNQKVNKAKKQKYLNKLFKVIIILFIAFSVVETISQAIKPVFETLCKDKAKSIATRITNEETSNVMKNYNYQDLFIIEKDSEGNINMIKSNIFPINEITSNIALKIQNRIDNEGKTDVGIALGTFSGVKILSGRGPNVNIKISSIGNVETDLKSEFSAQGINQTLHRVYLQVKCQISILTPFSNTEETVTNQILIAENVIVGNIPSTYYNLNGKILLNY